MKKKIKAILKRNPFVQKCVDYKNYLRRKKSLQLILKNNAKRKQNHKISFEGQAMVSIIILNRNGLANLKDLMESFNKSDFYENFEIIFIDNASTDASVEYIEKWKETYNIQIICNAENRSFSAGNNQGAELAKGEYLLFLNNDVAVTDGWLDELLLAITEQDNPGAVGARLVYPKILGDKQVKEKAYAIQHRGISFKDTMRQKQHFVRPYNMSNGEIAKASDDTIIERVAVMAAALIVKKEAFQAVGGFSEEYYYGFEDVDFCLKLYEKGYKNYYCPHSIIYHYEFGTRDRGQTEEAKKRGNHNVAVFQGKWQRYLSKEMLLDKLKGRKLFTESSLQIAIAYKETEKSDDILKLESQLKQKGYKVFYLNCKDEKKYYNISPARDVLLVMDSSYQVEHITNHKSDLLVIKISEYFSEQPGDYTLSIKQLIDDDLCLESALKATLVDEIHGNEIDICGCMPKEDAMKFWGDWHFAVAMKKEFEARGYSVNILTRLEWYRRSTAKYTIYLRGNREYYPMSEDGRVAIMWNISHPEEVSIAEYNSFDYVFFGSDKLKEQLGDKIECESDVLMQCTDERVMTAEENSNKKYELLFVGNSREVYRQILKDLLPPEYDLTVIGRNWEAYPVQEYVVQPYISNDEVGQAYHDAKIVLNDHWEDMREQGIISNRIYDVLAAGGFVISDYMSEIEETFEGAVVTYQDREDLKAKIDYYMQHEDARLEKVKKGQKIVLREHTFSNRVEKIVQVMKQL